MKKVLRLLAAVTVAASIMASPSPALAEDPGPIGFSLITPAENLVLSPGEVTASSITLRNQQNTPLELHLRHVTMVPKDNGQLQVVPEPSEFFSDIVMPASVQLEPNGSLEVPVSFKIAKDAAPDLYFFGLVAEATPAPQPGRITMNQQIGGYIVAEIPGKAHRDVKITLDKQQRFVVGSSIKGAYTVVNTGDAAARIRGQLRVVEGKDRVLQVLQTTGDQQVLLPTGTSRHVTWDWKPGGITWISKMHTELEIAYPDGSPKLATKTVSGPTFWLIHPMTIIIPAVLFGLIVLWIIATPIRRKARRSSLERRRDRAQRKLAEMDAKIEESK